MKPGDNTKYQNFINAIAKVANQYPNTWNGKTNIPKEAAEIKTKLHECEMFLKQCMENADMFGSKFTEDEDDY